MAELSFSREGAFWEAVAQSGGVPAAVEVCRRSGGAFLVTGSVGGLRDVELCYMDRDSDADLLIEVDVPSGVELRFRSWSEVEAASAEGL